MKKTLNSLFVAVALLAPLPAHALSITAADTVAGFGTEIAVVGAAAGEYDTIVTSPTGAITQLHIGETAAWLEGSATEVAGTYTVRAADAETSFSVIPDLLDTERSTIEAKKTDVGRADVRVTLVDRYGNPLPRRPVQLISSIATDRVASANRETDDSGTAQFTLTMRELGSRTLQAVDLIGGTVLGNAATIGDVRRSFGGPYQTYPTSSQYPTYPMYPTPMFFPNVAPFPNPNPNPYAASLLDSKRFYGQAITQISHVESFAIEVTNRLDPESIRAQDDFASLAITAVDGAGNRVDDYVGTVLLSSTDPNAILPLEGTVQFEPRNLGRKQLTLGLAFTTPGEQWLHAVDSANPAIEGYYRFNVVGMMAHETEKLITLITPQDGERLNVSTVTVKGNGPPFINIVILGGKKENVPAETDRDGFFSIELALDPAKTEHTITAQDDSGKYESEEVTFMTDIEAPKASRVTFIPETPQEETDVLLVIETEPDLKEASVRLEEAEHKLTVIGEEVGKYQILLTAPLPGVYAPVITLTDAFGNTAEIETTLRVAPKGLPRVSGVAATPEPNAVALSWDELAGVAVDGYRIYVGTSATEFLYTLDTDRPTSAATIAGLRPGNGYVFAVTAIHGERESEEKSEIVSAMPLGLTLSATPQDSALLLEWSDLGDDLPLASYLLEYSVEQDAYTEKRSLNGELHAFTLRDLINDIPYYIKLTPISTTGEPLDDFTATGEGTPFTRVTGFRPSVGDPIPLGLLAELHSGAPSEPPPRTPEPPSLSREGIPVPLLGTAAIAAAAVMASMSYHRRKMRTIGAFFAAVQHTYHG